MKQKTLFNILVLCLCSFFCVPAQAHNDSTKVHIPKVPIYGGTQVKLDILSPVVVAGINHWQVQHYELAVNVRCAQRFYPTLEVGYAGGETTQGDTIDHKGYGGFFRVGCDINPLKKHPESPHAMLIGVRLGTAVQEYGLLYTNGMATKISTGADCWGEIVAGCQVEIAEVNTTAFYMGWMGRFKFLFTRKGDSLYIPGYGARDNIGWGVNYYLGWRF